MILRILLFIIILFAIAIAVANLVGSFMMAKIHIEEYKDGLCGRFGPWYEQIFDNPSLTLFGKIMLSFLLFIISIPYTIIMLFIVLLILKKED